MTYEKIKQLRTLKKMIRINEERLEELEARLAPGIGKVTGMPRAGTSQNMIEELVPKIIELKGLIHHYTMEYYDLEIEIESFIATVSDIVDRLILILRFLRGCSWRKVATEIGGGNTPDSVRKRAFRILKNSEK